MDNRRKIALFMDETVNPISQEMYRGIRRQLMEEGMSLYVFVGDALANPQGSKGQFNLVYDLINPKDFDGYLIMGGALGQYVPLTTVEKFTERFAKVRPVVSIQLDLPSARSILIDNYAGIRQLIIHLIQDHGLREIAFIRGPEGHPEAEERYKAYQDALKQCNIAMDTGLICEGDFSPEAGWAGVSTLFDKRHRKPQAIACVDDDTAVGVVEALQERGLTVPADCAVTGFDNSLSSQQSDPPLSTVGQDFDALGYKAASELVAIINNAVTIRTGTVKIATNVYLRESCGCTNAIIDDILQRKESDSRSPMIASEIQTLDSLIENPDPSPFFSEITKLMGNRKEHHLPEEDTYRTLTEACSAMADENGRIDMHTARKFMAGSAYLGMRMMVSEISHRSRIEREVRDFSDMSDDLNIEPSMSGVVKEAYKVFPDLGIDYFALGLFSKENSMDRIKVEGAYGPSGEGFNLDNMPTSAFILEGARNLSASQQCFIKPLCLAGDSFGLAFFQLDEAHMEYVDRLTAALSATIKRLNLLDFQARARALAEEKSRQIREQVQPTLEAINRLSALIEERVKSVEILSRSTAEGEQRLRETDVIVRVVNDQMRSLSKMSSSISDISEMVNVLAINAGIESAHAGKYGAGFKVIAQEVRKLSENTAQNAKGILGLVGNIVKDMERTGEMSSINAKLVQDIHENVAEFVNVLNTITEGMHTLANSSHEILKIMQE